MDQIRDDQSQRPKKLRYKIGDLLKTIGLAKATYHDERKRIARSHDKYEEAKAQILKIAQRFRLRGRWTAGYRRSTPPEVGRFFSKSPPEFFCFQPFFNKKYLKTLLYQHLFSYYKNVVVSI